MGALYPGAFAFRPGFICKGSAARPGIAARYFDVISSTNRTFSFVSKDLTVTECNNQYYFTCLVFLMSAVSLTTFFIDQIHNDDVGPCHVARPLAMQQSVAAWRYNLIKNNLS